MKSWLFSFIIILISASCTRDEVVPFHHAIDEAIINKMSEYNIPGLSLAIVKDEKLVYANSYGVAIREPATIITNNHLFRLASVSKVVTAIAILKLVSDEIISLDQTVFGDNGILQNDYGSPPPGSLIDQITVRHLMEHKSGWANAPYDLVFAKAEYTQNELLEELVTKRTLSNSPGNFYYYLNIGYVVLGRVIEKASGETYEEYITSNILNLAGITDMKIGGSLLSQRLNNEVQYYAESNDIDVPYLLNLERMDGAAGWIGSATALARLVVRIDKGINKQDIIPQELLDQFYFKSTSWYHYGVLPGNSCVAARLNDSFSIVILSNSGSHASILDLYETTKTIVTDIRWPGQDLF